MKFGVVKKITEKVTNSQMMFACVKTIALSWRYHQHVSSCDFKKSYLLQPWFSENPCKQGVPDNDPEKNGILNFCIFEFFEMRGVQCKKIRKIHAQKYVILP